MASEENPNREEDYDEQFYQAFGEHTGIDKHIRDEINDIKNNDPGSNEFILDRSDVDHFTDLSWRLLGRYIANNTHLEELDLNYCDLTNERATLLFGELSSSSSLSELDIRYNRFDIEGLRCMISLLQNSPNLSRLYLNRNNFNSECFELLVSTLQVSSRIHTLYFEKCNVTNISALETYYLPNLQRLTLAENNIGRDGCRILSSVLQRDDTSLKYLYLDNTGIDDEGSEFLAASLLKNTMLLTLSLVEVTKKTNFKNNITQRGRRAFLKVLVDVSSIDNTYKANHTLTALSLFYNIAEEMHIKSILRINRDKLNSHAAGRAKVIKYQLNSKNRKEMCDLQGIEYSTEDNVLADIEPILLPDILAKIGREHGHSDFYTALLQVAPDLMSFIDRKGMIKDSMEKYAAKISELTAEYNKLGRRLALIELGESKQQPGVGVNSKEGGGEKRQRVSYREVGMGR